MGFELGISTLAPTRAPLDLVKEFAATPRFGGEEKGFDATSQYWYVSESIVFVTLFLCFGLLAFYKLWHYARGCCWKCQRDVETDNPNPGMCCAGQVDSSQAQRSILFAWLLGAVLAFGALTIVAQGRLDRTTESVEDGAKDLADLFEGIDGLSDDLRFYSVLASDAAAQLECVDASFEDEIQEYVGDFRQEADAVKETTDGAGDEVDKVERLVEGRQTLVDWFLLGVVCLVALVLPSALYGCVLASPWCLEKVTARYAFFVCVVLALLLAVEFGALVKASDFCEAPDANFLDLVDHKLSLDAQDEALVEYYVTCGGANPLFAPLNATLRDVDQLSAAVEVALDSDLCEPSSALEDLQAACDGALDVIDQFQVAAACEAVNPTYQDLVHVSLCRHFVTGLYFLAVAHAVAGAALFLFLFACDYVAETIQLGVELEDLKCEVLATPRHPRAAGARPAPRTLEAELSSVSSGSSRRPEPARSSRRPPSRAPSQ